MFRFFVLLFLIFGTHLKTSAQDTAKATSVYDQWAQGMNRQITELAPVLNSPSLSNAVAIESDLEKSPLEIMCKRYGNSLYVFVANLGPEKSVAKLRLLNPRSGSAKAREIENGNEVKIRDSIINVEMAGYGIVLYRIDG